MISLSQQHGFTLIELMIVVAIIAILAAIAIPQYNDYVARAQLSEAVALGGAFQTAISVHYEEVPDASFCTVAGGISEGKYVSAVAAANATDSNCDIVATMRSGVSAKASGKTVTFNYTHTPAAGQPKWTCATDAPVEVAPKACLP